MPSPENRERYFSKAVDELKDKSSIEDAVDLLLHYLRSYNHSANFNWWALRNNASLELSPEDMNSEQLELNENIFRSEKLFLEFLKIWVESGNRLPTKEEKKLFDAFLRLAEPFNCAEYRQVYENNAKVRKVKTGINE